jgi:hypothetical protein
MAIYSKLNKENKVVDLVVVEDSLAENEGIALLLNITEHTNWKQVDKPNRRGSGGIGSFYNEDKDAFIMTQPYPSWVLNETTCLWEAPISRPDTNNPYNWNETEQTWDLIEDEE